MSACRFWLWHAVPAAAVLITALLFAASHGIDTRIADALFFDAAAERWIGAGTWWAEDLIHTGGRDFVRAVAAMALLLALAGRPARLGIARRGALYVFLSIVLGSALVGSLKHVTNVDCPWDLEGYGGDRPLVGLFADRPDELPRARCFPGAHAASGFTLMCFYFLLRDRRRRLARRALVAGIATGVLFAFGQEARGAHFLSHDLTSAALVWFVLLGLYAAVLRGPAGAARPTGTHAQPGFARTSVTSAESASRRR